MNCFVDATDIFFFLIGYSLLLPAFARHAQICECKEYWDCVLGGGQPISFCGLQDSSVCCVPKPKWHGECGNKGPDVIQNEGVAGPGEWPWHAAILEKNAVYVCGASLIDEYWILTAAHCVDKYDAGVLKVRLGEHDVSSVQEPILHEERNVAQIIVHPEFDNKTLTNDIAILRLKVPADKKSNIDIVCVPEVDRVFGKNNTCFITGWGRRTEETKHSVVLKEVQVPLWDNSECQVALQKHFGSRFTLSNTGVCAGAEGRDACDGDGGGPLVCEENGKWYQVGVVSFGVGCGRRDIPGVYTRVQHYRKWILSTVLQHRPKRTHV